ncbi:MAG: KilA-N domain-containing protein [Sediminibacterium sp.]
MKKNKLISIQNLIVTVTPFNGDDYICLTDMAKAKSQESRSADVIKNWLRTRYTLEFLGTWELIYNPDFKVVEFDHLKMQAGLHSFVLSPNLWVEKTNEFASAISPEFKLYLIKEYQRLKESEMLMLKQEWSIQRQLSKMNYKIHTDVIKDNLIPKELNKKQISLVYAAEADVLNMALFGKTAKEWRDKNQLEKGNIRDHATIHQLIVLSNLENINSLLIAQGEPQHYRLTQLNRIAISQMMSLVNNQKKLIV